MYQDERKLDFKPLGIAIKKAREAKGWTQEYLAQLVDLTPRSIMYIENRGQHPRLNKFYLITTLLDISVDQFFFPCNEDGDNNRRKQVKRYYNAFLLIYDHILYHRPFISSIEKRNFIADFTFK